MEKSLIRDKHPRSATLDTVIFCSMYNSVLIIRIRDPGTFLIPGPGSGMGEITIRIRIRDEQPGSYFRELRNNFLG
jgi:hypothetical protein